jgi:hypothetical protein
MNRRDLIKISAGAAAIAARGQSKHKFFTPDEFAAVDELTELIIPADEKSGGARAARVADYIDFRLSEAFEQSSRDEWRTGLAQFLKAPDRLALLTKLSNANDPFFATLKHQTISAYYSSKIGIEDQDYKGNTYQQGDYSGELP